MKSVAAWIVCANLLILAGCGAGTDFPGVGTWRPEPDITTAIVRERAAQLAGDLSEAQIAEQVEGALAFRVTYKADGTGVLSLHPDMDPMAFTYEAVPQGEAWKVTLRSTGGAGDQTSVLQVRIDGDTMQVETDQPGPKTLVRTE